MCRHTGCACRGRSRGATHQRRPGQVEKRERPPISANDPLSHHFSSFGLFDTQKGAALFTAPYAPHTRTPARERDPDTHNTQHTYSANPCSLARLRKSKDTPPRAVALRGGTHAPCGPSRSAASSRCVKHGSIGGPRPLVHAVSAWPGASCPPWRLSLSPGVLTAPPPLPLPFDTARRRPRHRRPSGGRLR